MRKADPARMVDVPRSAAQAQWPILLAPMILGLAFAFMAWRTWGHWPDPLIDFGRELYTPWRITEGQVLYRDISAFYGPLSQYVNAAVFTVFGVSLQTLEFWNLGITALMTWWIYALLLHVSGRLTAFAGSLTFILVFAFGQYISIGNYNFVTPYSHEAMHGCVLAFAGMLCAWKFLDQGRSHWLMIEAFVAGLTFLTKPEAFMALAAALVCAGALTLSSQTDRRRKLLQALPWMVAVFALPILIAFGLLAAAMPAKDALFGVAGSWPFVFNRQMMNLPFFQSVMGIDVPYMRIREMLIGMAAYLAIAGTASVVAMFAPRSTRVRYALSAALGLASAAAVWILWTDMGSWAFSRPLPAIVAIAGIVTFVGFIRERQFASRAALATIQTAFCVFAMVYIFRMILNARVIHYGFILALPATLVTTAFLGDWLPRRIDLAGGSGMVIRSAVLAALAVVAYKHLDLANRVQSIQTYSVGEGDDQFWTDPRGMDDLVKGTLSWLSLNTQSDQTLVVIPEGVMLNYLSRRPTTIPLLTMLPTDLKMFGEQTALDSLKAHPPDFIVLVHRNTAEYGPRFIGYDYGESIVQWVSANYKPVAQFGQPPLEPESVFGLEILKRR